MNFGAEEIETLGATLILLANLHII